MGWLVELRVDDGARTKVALKKYELLRTQVVVQEFWAFVIMVRVLVYTMAR